MPNGYTPQIYGGSRLTAQHFNHKNSNSSLASSIMYQSGVNSSTSSLPQSNSSLQIQKVGNYYAQQLEAAQRARVASSPHHHARVAASQMRMNNLNSTSNSVSNSQSNISTAEQFMIPKAAPPPENSSWTALDMGGMMINHIHDGLFSYSFLTALYLNHNNLTSLTPAISKLHHLAILNLTGNQLSSLPVELGMVTSLKELLLFDNQLTFIPPELGQLYQLELLGLEGNPMSEPIGSMIGEKGTVEVIKYLRDSCPCPPGPADREWIEIEDNTGVNSADVLTIMSYNVLCEKYATPQAYGYTPSWALDWDYRKDMLLQEMLNYSADIICLQELEMGQYEDFFQEQLYQQGEYKGEYFAKSRSRTMNEHDRRQVDGCATMYKSQKFKLLDKHQIEFQQIAMQRSDLNRSEDVLNRVMVKDNVGLIVLLESIETNAKLLVANAHLHWDPEYADVKVIQTALLASEVDSCITKWKKQYKIGNLSTIICGDFNSLPDSGPIEFLSNGYIAGKHEELGDYNYGLLTENGMKHSMKLKSAYSLCEDIEFTNFTPMFKGIIDYIWYDTTSLITTGLLGGVDKNYAARTVGFPNPHHPSDHIPLVVSMRIKSNTISSKKK